ncbi:succinyl-diaminopimelate desuccinylase [Nakamurella silvestris]|nr:succinyl-diaminopimelate desuccinylase [Nakamurella silvestris]
MENAHEQTPGGLALDLTQDPGTLTRLLVDIPSVSGDEALIADTVEASLRALGRFEVLRSGNAVLARTNLGRATRVMLAGHLDTVPIADNVPSRLDGDTLHGCGTTDMKSGDAMFLHLAATLEDPSRDLTLVFYDCEEVEHDRNGLGRIERELPEWLVADLAILGEPTNAKVEAGCQGVLTFQIELAGRRSHAARSWLGVNAIHAAAPVLARLNEYESRTVEIDGCRYREGVNAVSITGGVASNVIPDTCTVKINFRFAPDRSVEEATLAMKDLFEGFDVTVLDSAAAALPGLSSPAATEFIAAAGGQVAAKYGWTDVSRFAALGIPAVNYGCGDSSLAHTREEWVSLDQIRQMTEVLRAFLA